MQKTGCAMRPGKENAPRGNREAQLSTQTTNPRQTMRPDSSNQEVSGQAATVNAEQIREADARRKRFTTAQARVALAGNFVLRELADGSFVASRWGVCRELATLDDVVRWVNLVTGTHA